MREVTAEWLALAGGGDPIVEPLRELVGRLDVRLLGIGGPPGAGKSTIARGLGGLSISLDDFYLSKTERTARGLAWRGLPGSHDIDALLDVLDRLSRRDAPVSIPRFSAALDDRIEPVTLDAVPDLVVLEGWLLGIDEDGYRDALDRLDLFVYLHVDIETARRRRFEREEELRARGGGFTTEQMQHFWDDVLAPGIARYLSGAREAADVVIDAGDDGVRTVTTSHPALMRDWLRGRFLD